MYCTKCGAKIDDSAAFCPACGQAVAPAAGAVAPAGPASPVGPPAATATAAMEAATIRTAYAGFWLRFVAWIIDSLILSAAFLIILVPLTPLLFRHRPFEGPILMPATMALLFWFYALNLLCVWLYFALFESSTWQGTPGKRALGLFVTDMQGRRISFGRATVRFFGKLLSSAVLFIGYFMAGFTAQKQALHDMLADCLVLRHI